MSSITIVEEKTNNPPDDHLHKHRAPKTLTTTKQQRKGKNRNKQIVETEGTRENDHNSPSVGVVREHEMNGRNCSSTLHETLENCLHIKENRCLGELVTACEEQAQTNSFALNAATATSNSSSFSNNKITAECSKNNFHHNLHKHHQHCTVESQEEVIVHQNGTSNVDEAVIAVHSTGAKPKMMSKKERNTSEENISSKNLNNNNNNNDTAELLKLSPTCSNHLMCSTVAKNSKTVSHCADTSINSKKLINEGNSSSSDQQNDIISSNSCNDSRNSEMMKGIDYEASVNEKDLKANEQENVVQATSSSSFTFSFTASQIQIDYKEYESELQMQDIMRLIQSELSEPYSIYTYRYFIYNWPKLCFLAAHGDEYVGAIVCKLDMHMNFKRGYIAMLAVKREYRKLKIGTTLVEKAIEAMRADGADEVVLETEMKNIPALRLYENLGFVRDKRLFRYYLNGVDALRLKLWFR